VRSPDSPLTIAHFARNDSIFICVHPEVLPICHIAYVQRTKPAEKCAQPAVAVGESWRITRKWQRSYIPQRMMTFRDYSRHSLGPRRSPSGSATILSRSGLKSGCRQCHYKRKRSDEETTAAQKTARLSIPTGDATEVYVENLLRTHPHVEEVNRIGASGASCDLVLTLKTGECVQLQVKTLGVMEDKKDTDTMKANVRSKYDPDLLLVLVDKARSKFAFVQYKYVNVKSTLSVNFRRTKNSNLSTFLDESAFLEALVRKSTESTPFFEMAQVLTKTQLKEHNMTESFASAVLENTKLPLRLNDTHFSDVDCYVGRHALQLKFTSQQSGCCFHALCHTHGVNPGVQGQKESSRGPYSVPSTFDFIVVQLGAGDDQPEPYPGQFCILPKAILAEKGILTDESRGIVGRAALPVAPPGIIDHWTSSYWNRWELLQA
jgi:hypothetical protein